MKKDELIKLGIEEKVAEEILVIHGKDIEKLKATNETLSVDNTALTKQVTEANTAIEGFKKLDVGAIQKAADDWKVKFETSEAEGAKKLAAVEFEHSLDAALTAAKAKNLISVKAHLDRNNLKMSKDGTILGLKEQLEKIQPDNSYLFEPSDEAEPIPTIVKGTKSDTVISDKMVNAAREAAGIAPPKK